MKKKTFKQYSDLEIKILLFIQSIIFLLILLIAIISNVIVLPFALLYRIAGAIKEFFTEDIKYTLIASLEIAVKFFDDKFTNLIKE